LFTSTWILRARRFRRLLPYGVALILFTVLKPSSGENEGFNELSTALGIWLCMIGEGWRLWAWGCNGGMGKFAIRSRGPYAFMRHPLYAGNFLIAFGLTTTYNNPWAYLFLPLPLACLYYTIACADEQRMKARFGVLYESYVTKHMTRFVPQLGKLVAALQTTRPFNWMLAWGKEYNSVCAWTAGIAALAFYKKAISYGWDVAWQQHAEWLIVSGSCGILAAAWNVTRRIRREKSTARSQRFADQFRFD
jgi:protein-S-isoprenylcysteine O-methyltransferase Ste14